MPALVYPTCFVILTASSRIAFRTSSGTEKAGGRPDEFDPGLLAGPGKRSVLGQKAIAGMNGVAVTKPRQLNDPWDIQISAQRALVLSGQIGLVRGGPERTVQIIVKIYENS